MVSASQLEEFLTRHGCPRTWEHSQMVAIEARALARRFGVNESLAEQAAWLHDISAVIPDSERLGTALRSGVEVLPEEAGYPLILHQKLSVVLARQEFGINDQNLLSAIGCHTTLKAQFSKLDLVLFVADKLAWDQPGEAPFAPAMRAGLERGLEQAALAYLDYLWQQRAELKCIHPWMLAARDVLNQFLNQH